MMDNWYDTKEGIEESVKTLAGLNRLVTARAENKSKNNRFRQWVLFGWVFLDTFGQVGKIEEFVAAPPVCTMDEYRIISEAAGTDAIGIRSGGCIPRDNTPCHFCGEHWTVEDAHDLYVKEGNEHVDLMPFFGRTVAELMEHTHRQFGHHKFQSLYLHNKNYIDTSLKYPGTNKEWEKDILKNPNGYVDVSKQPERMIDYGDSLTLTVFRFYHTKCWQLKREHEERRLFTSIFRQAGYQRLKAKPILNQYFPDYVGYSSWFEFETEIGTFEIGWRKRVVSITFKESPVNIAELFADEDVTMDKELIHAWGYSKVKEYLEKIRLEVQTVAV